MKDVAPQADHEAAQYLSGEEMKQSLISAFIPTRLPNEIQKQVVMKEALRQRIGSAFTDPIKPEQFGRNLVESHFPFVSALVSLTEDAFYGSKRSLSIANAVAHWYLTDCTFPLKFRKNQKQKASLVNTHGVLDGWVLFEKEEQTRLAITGVYLSIEHALQSIDLLSGLALDSNDGLFNDFISAFGIAKPAVKSAIGRKGKTYDRSVVDKEVAKKEAQVMLPPTVFIKDNGMKPLFHMMERDPDPCVNLALQARLLQQAVEVRRMLPRAAVDILPFPGGGRAIVGYTTPEQKQHITSRSHTHVVDSLANRSPDQRLCPGEIATCIRFLLKDMPSEYVNQTQSLRQGIVSATRALHSRGHRDDLGRSRNSGLKQIGVGSLIFRQRGQEFDIEIEYHGSTLPLRVGADGTFRFPPDIHDTEARAKLELIVLSHLGEILDIHRKPREEPSTARGSGKPTPYRGRHLQIQPEGKMTRQLAKPGTNASVQDWLELPTADMTWINLAFNLAQEATHLANTPSDQCVSYLVEQGVHPIVAAKVSDLMQRLKDRKKWPPMEGEPLVIRQVSFVDEMKDVPGTGLIDTDTTRAERQYRDMLPPKETPPLIGTVYSAPNSS